MKTVSSIAYNDSMKRGLLWALFVSLTGIGGLWSAHAVTFDSTNYSINGTIGGSTAGGQSSTNYRLTSQSGESIAGNSASKSYKLGLGYLPTLENSLQVVVQPNGLAAHWPLDDVTSTGPMLDESQNQNNGSYSASSISGTGKVGSAWNDLNGGQSATAPDSASLPAGSSMTISAWVNSSNLSNQRAIVTKWDYAVAGGGQGEWALQLAPAAGELRMFVSAGSGDDGGNYVDTTNAGITTGTWNHVSVVYDGVQAASNRIKIFVNGSQKTTTIGGTIPATLYAAGTNPVTIGNFPGLSRFWGGSIDEVKLYERALTANEVKAEYDAGNAGVPAGLSLGAVTPGTSQAASFDSIVQTSAGGYTLAINQNTDLTNGGSTIPAVSGSIASPVTWSEGSTKGLGFTLYGTNATTLPAAWSTGAAYAAIPGSSTSFYTRSNYTGGTKDILNMRLRLDTTTPQAAGDYTNQLTITGTMTP